MRQRSTMELTNILLVTFLALVGSYNISAKSAPRWCAQNIKAFRKCKEVQRATGKIKCVLARGEKGCYNKIGNGMADMSAFDGGSIYHAGKEFGLKVIMSERLKSLAASGTKYFGIAVVKASSSLTFDTLKGAKSCHTGVQKSSGWIIPVGALMNSGIMPRVSNDQYASVAAFFSASCAPGASSPRYNPNLYGVQKLCKLCSGTGSAKCARSSIEPYYGYEGAFQCLKDGAGDVAFIKQSILTVLSDKEQAKYKLLCPDNTRKDPKDFASCNLAGAPAHAILTRADATEEEIAGYQALLEAADRRYGVHANSPLKMYDGSLFSKSAIGLDRVPVEKRAFNQYLDSAYIGAISEL